MSKNNTGARAKASGILTGAVGGILSCNPVSGFCWSIWKEGQDAKWKYRVEEFMDYVSKGLSADLLKDEQFQDGLAHLFKAFVQQRHKEKREYIKNIFTHFSYANDKANFELERLIDIVEKISINQVMILARIYNGDFLSGKGIQELEILGMQYCDLKTLENLGIVLVGESVINSQEQPNFSFNPGHHSHIFIKTENGSFAWKNIVTTPFGEQFIQYIQNL
ncbi:MAG: hypothetical protein NTZ80_00900 [Patescibacteria group bacterium]|nr:hypothetical protein [Patescibacteria group bacterium]